MKTRFVMSLIAVALTAAMIGGATMAWFTSSVNVPNTTFTTATVLLSETNNYAQIPTTVINTWNPGDNTPVEWTFKNNGNTPIQIRAKVTRGWETVVSKTTSMPNINHQLQAFARIGVDGAQTWELGLLSPHHSPHSPLPGTQKEFIWPKGQAVPFKLEYNGQKVTYTVGTDANAVVMSYDTIGNFNDIVVNTKSTSSANSAKVDNLKLNGVDIAGESFIKANGNDYLWIKGGNMSSFVLTGQSTFDWDGVRPTQSHLTYAIYLGASVDNVVWTFTGDDAAKWTQDGEWLYYTGGPVAAGGVAKLFYNVHIDGPTTGNEFQNKAYTFGLVAEAVQASNDAPFHVWGTTLFR